MSTTLGCQVERVTFENEETGFRVVRARAESQEPLTLVGVFQAVGPGMQVRVTGKFAEDAKHGKQFRVDSLVPIDPKTVEGIEKYLASGSIAGVGPGFARRIVQRFGAETLQVLDHQPARLVEVPGVSARRAEKITQGWSEQRAQSGLVLLLQRYAAPPHLAKLLSDRYGDKAAEVVQHAPYRLALEVRGVGFKTADAMARAMGVSLDHPERVQAGIVQELEDLSGAGHVLCLRTALVVRVVHRLEVDEAHVQAGVDALWASELLTLRGEDVYLSRLYRAELGAATALKQLLGAPPPKPLAQREAMTRFEAQFQITLAPLQRQAIEVVALERVCVLTGGPGVGKTTLVRAMVMAFEQAKLEVRLAAPTGRAAKRLSEATGRPAQTLHRLLEYDPRLRAFTRSRERPLALDVLVVDEASMLDVMLAHALFQALPPTARLVIVGDSDQLPSVGPGAVLRDVLASGVVPSLRLSNIFRQSEQSGIVVNAHRVLAGELPEASPDAAQEGGFFVIQRSDPSAAADLIRRLVVERIPARFGFRAREDIQVLCPMHKGAAGTRMLNQLLQSALNPNAVGITHRAVTFFEGDKVLQTKNDYDKDVFNGDAGVVEWIDVEAHALRVRFEERSVSYQRQELDSLVLAYAMSVHKSQGSEYPVVVMPLLTAHFTMLSRNLLYTAITRAKKLCVLVADRRALKLAIGVVAREERLTRLAQALRQGLSEVAPSPAVRALETP